MTIAKLPAYGGQALIEGVLMRGSRFLAAAFRIPNGEIVVQTEKLPAVYYGPLKKIPFLRGLVILWDSLGLGTRYLTISANHQGGEEEAKIEGPTLFFSLGIALVFGVAIFFLLPALVSQGIEKLIGSSGWSGSLIEGILRLLILVGYIASVGRIPDIARVFAYHGAEHKTINAYEAGSDLSPEKVMAYSVEHPRCGTSFLLTVVLLSIIFFSLMGPLPIFWRLLSRIIFIPLLVTVAYEYIRWTANHLNNRLVRWLIWPNLALQRLTTREPTPDMVEVSIAAFNTMLNLENDAFTAQT
jgi:uncharacterized protein YqhQ